MKTLELVRGWLKEKGIELQLITPEPFASLTTLFDQLVKEAFKSSKSVVAMDSPRGIFIAGTDAVFVPLNFEVLISVELPLKALLRVYNQPKSVSVSQLLAA